MGLERLPRLSPSPGLQLITFVVLMEPSFSNLQVWTMKEKIFLWIRYFHVFTYFKLRQYIYFPSPQEPTILSAWYECTNRSWLNNQQDTSHGTSRVIPAGRTFQVWPLKLKHVYLFFIYNCKTGRCPNSTTQNKVLLLKLSNFWYSGYTTWEQTETQVRIQNFKESGFKSQWQTTVASEPNLNK